MDLIEKKKLAALLLEAERAHALYEKELGSRDKDWSSWYAEYIIKNLNN